MHFVDYDLCKNGKWEKKSCDKGSLFWVITDCCIPIEKYPTFDECMPMKEDKNVNKATESPPYNKVTTNTPENSNNETNSDDSSEKNYRSNTTQFSTQSPYENESSEDKDNLDTAEEELSESQEDRDNISEFVEWGGYRHKDEEGIDSYKSFQFNKFIVIYFLLYNT